MYNKVILSARFLTNIQFNYKWVINRKHDGSFVNNVFSLFEESNLVTVQYLYTKKFSC